MTSMSGDQAHGEDLDLVRNGDEVAFGVTRETIELAYLPLIQLLPPNQRAVLVLRDVLGWTAAETADLLDTSVPSVTSALQRARDTLGRRRVSDEPLEPTRPTSEERSLLDRYMEAQRRADTAALTSMLKADVQFTMPPQPLCVAGRRAVGDFFADALRTAGRVLLVETTANRSPAAATTSWHPATTPTVRCPAPCHPALPGRGDRCLLTARTGERRVTARGHFPGRDLVRGQMSVLVVKVTADAAAFRKARVDRAEEFASSGECARAAGGSTTGADRSPPEITVTEAVSSPDEF